MTDPCRAKRKEFTDQLGKNWDRKRDELFPQGPRTRDDKYIVGAIDRARDDDIGAIFGESRRLWVPYFDLPVEAALRPASGETAVSREPSKAEKLTSRHRPTPELMSAWLSFHPQWVSQQLPVIVADAIQHLRAVRSYELAERRRKRKNVWRNGRRTKVNKPGPRPSRKPNLTCKKVVSRKKAG